MAGAAGLVGVLGVLMIAYYFILGSRVGVGGVFDDRGHRVSDANFGGSVSAFFTGLVAVLALAELAAVGDSGGGSFTAGALIGVLAAAGILLRQTWPGRLGFELFYSVLGLAASVPAIARLFAGSGCDVGVEPVVRIVAVVLMAVIWASMLIGTIAWAFMTGWRNSASGLALFGALDTIIVMSGPVGAGFVGSTGAVLILLLVAVIGGLSGLATNVVMIASGAFLAFIQFLTTTTGLGAECDSLISGAPGVMLVGYAVVFWLAAWFISRIRRRRSLEFGGEG